MNLNQPIDQFGPDGLFNFNLFLHVLWIRVPFAFMLQHIGMDVTAKLRNVVDVVNSAFVYALHFIENFGLASEVKFIHFLIRFYFR